MDPMRVAWFSPLPPVRSGVAAVNATLVPRLDTTHAIDRFVATRHAGDAANVFDAHDFVWKARREPYDLVVYQLGNAACHDYMWAYLARYPGLVVLHDPRLHHARARQLLHERRFDDYRREFWHDHPEAPRDFVEYAVEGLGGPIYYQWSMAACVVRTARVVAVHNARVAADLAAEFPEARVDTIRLGTPAPTVDPEARDRVRAALGAGARDIVFSVFGKITAEKRIGAIVRAFTGLASERSDVHLLLAGDASEYAALARDRSSSPAAARIHVAGYLDDRALEAHLAAADACLCLRWPTALESSASWLQCLAAGRPTIVSDLAHTVDVPAAVDLVDEDASLVAAMRALADDARLRDAVGEAGRAYWSANHTLEAMTDDYRRVIRIAAAAPTPVVADLPAHFTDDHSARACDLARTFGVDIDILHRKPKDSRI
jgi:glycosyltransferase involved in cell wall biosynthesis